MLVPNDSSDAFHVNGVARRKTGARPPGDGGEKGLQRLGSRAGLGKGVGVKKRFLTAVAGALVVGAVAAPSAGARADSTITETCTDGTVLTMDANAYNGISTAETHYNAHNPSGTVCSIETP